MAAVAEPRSLAPSAWLLLGVPLALAAAAASVAAPLAVYSLTLAAFGLPHVLSELRYVDRRFGRALGWPTIAAMALLLVVIVGARSAGLAHRLTPETEQPLELGLVALLALTAAVRAGPLGRLVALGLGLMVGALALLDPFETMIAFAVLHNLTPLGFLWQLSPRAQRGRVMVIAAAVFVGLPLIVATGLPRMLLAGLAPGAADFDPVGAGSLMTNLMVYVPPSLLSSDHAVDLFTASVVAQQAHYLAVIGVLPWLLSRWSPRAKGLVPWPPAAAFYALIAVAGALAFGRFAADFTASRGLYGLAAAFHAWIELPILVIALTSAQPISRPTANEAPLASSETSRA